jgi:transcriptional regulator with XRE-family HTH domain
MTETTIDVPALRDAVAARVAGDSVSWRTAAGQIGVSPSLLTRLRNGQRPDLDAFARIVRWLRVEADRFIVNEDDLASRKQPALESEIALLLRARRDLNDSDRERLNTILRTGIQMVRESRAE